MLHYQTQHEAVCISSSILSVTDEFFFFNYNYQVIFIVALWEENWVRKWHTLLFQSGDLLNLWREITARLAKYEYYLSYTFQHFQLSDKVHDSENASWQPFNQLSVQEMKNSLLEQNI